MPLSAGMVVALPRWFFFDLHLLLPGKLFYRSSAIGGRKVRTTQGTVLPNRKGRL